jgi:hypothetical protein
MSFVDGFPARGLFIPHLPYRPMRMAIGEARAQAMICTQGSQFMDQTLVPAGSLLSHAHHHPRMSLDQPPRVGSLIPQPLTWRHLDRNRSLGRTRRSPIRAYLNIDQLHSDDPKLVMHGRDAVLCRTRWGAGLVCPYEVER